LEPKASKARDAAGISTAFFIRSTHPLPLV
jgi:hypothetical protein